MDESREIRIGAGSSARSSMRESREIRIRARSGERAPMEHDEPTPARHNTIGALKTLVFPGIWTPVCQFSYLARRGVEAQETLELPSF